MFRKRIQFFLTLIAFGCAMYSVKAQTPVNQLGAWYMYFWNTNINKGPLGLQGDIQHRNWDLGGDLEQLLLRGGITYSPKDAGTKFTLGYGDITSGQIGSSTNKSRESRVYQEALLSQKIGNRVYLNHRFRLEQRWVQNQDFRTRFRYNLFINIAFNKKEMKKGTFYLALYNELFINGQKRVSSTLTTQYFDRNRLYGAVGLLLKDNLKIQLGIMNQTSNSQSKNQLQVSLHHKIYGK